MRSDYYSGGRYSPHLSLVPAMLRLSAASLQMCLNLDQHLVQTTVMKMLLSLILTSSVDLRCDGGVEVITRSFEAIDNCGNTATCAQKIAVVDTTPPKFGTLPDITLECGQSPNDFDELPEVSDNCDRPVNVSFNDVISGGRWISRNYFAEDACGNTAEAEQVIETPEC